MGSIHLDVQNCTSKITSAISLDNVTDFKEAESERDKRLSICKSGQETYNLQSVRVAEERGCFNTQLSQCPRDLHVNSAAIPTATLHPATMSTDYCKQERAVYAKEISKCPSVYVCGFVHKCLVHNV